MKKKIKLPKLKMGADPEFCAKDGFEGYRKIKGVGEVGYDHGGRVGELRPRPGSPAKVVQNLQKMMAVVKELNHGAEIYGGGGEEFEESSGGHIHFGGIGRTYDERSTPNFKAFVKALDHYIGRPMRSHKGGKRSYSGYGQCGDIRPQPHGFEYRTAPSWLTSPELAESVLTVAHTIARLYLHRKNFWARQFAKWSKTRKRPRLDQSDIELLKKFSQEKDQMLHDQYINLMRDKTFNLSEAGTIKRWLKE